MKETACAILTTNDLILLALRSPERRSYPNCWDLLGGHLEQEETVEQALIRELQEEAGITPTRFQHLADITDISGGVCTVHHVFTVTGWSGGEPRMIGDEHSEFRWFAPDDAATLPNLARSEYHRIFAALTHDTGVL